MAQLMGFFFLVLILPGCEGPDLSDKTIKFDHETMSTNPDGGKVEGYWADNENEKSNFPFPKSHASTFPGQNNFVEALKKIQNDSSVEKDQFKGYSSCRFGDKPHNGSAEFHVGKGNDKISWPEGYLHYVTKHNVIPSREFYKFVMNYSRKI